MEDVTAPLKVAAMAAGLGIGIFVAIALICYLVNLVLTWRRNRDEVEYIKQNDISSDW